MPAAAAAPAPFPDDLRGQFTPDELLVGLLETSLTGFVLYLPIRGSDGTIVDFGFALLNAAAQQLLSLPARPAQTCRQLYPDASQNGVFEFYRLVFESGQPVQHHFSYQHHGLDIYFRLSARRVGEGLVVSLADTANEERTAAATARQQLARSEARASVINAELATTNEELQAANEEIRATNDTLFLAQVALHEFNQELEARVADRTARLQAAQSEAERERARLDRFFRQAPAAICILDGPNLVFELVNSAYQALFPGRRLEGRPLLQALPELTNHAVWQSLQRVYQTGESCAESSVPISVARYEGQPLEHLYFDYMQQARYNEHGQIDGVMVFAFEVTEQVLVKQRNDALQREMQHRDVQLQDLFEQAPVAIAVLRGPELVVELANSGVCALWGHTPDEVLGKPLLEAIPELRGQGFETLLERVMATGVPYVAQERPAQLPRNGEYETVFLNFVYQPLRDAEGRITGVAAVATDVSEQVAARQRLALANADLQAANEAVSVRNNELASTNQQLLRTNQDLDNFVYAASHDLKQPVNNLAGLFQEVRLVTVFTDPEEEAILVPMVDEALRQLSGTIDDLATVGQVQRLPELPAETVALEEITQELLQTLQPQVQAARARITTDFVARPTITYARASLRTILLNLLSNSLKYADPSRPCRVHLSVWVQEGRPVLLVEDNGLGFDVQRHRGELFHLFRRFHDHTEGTGVGLYLVNRIVQSHGGRVEVESEVGEGTSFRVFL